MAIPSGALPKTHESSTTADGEFANNHRAFDMPLGLSVVCTIPSSCVGSSPQASLIQRASPNLRDSAGFADHCWPPNRKFSAYSDTFPSSVSAQPIQTKTNVSDSGATVHQKLTGKSEHANGLGVCLAQHRQQGRLTAHKSEVFRLLGHFAPRYMNTSLLTTQPNASDSAATMHRTLISKKELAKELSVSPRTIDNWVRQKRIPAHRFSSRCIRFNPPKVLSALDRFEIREVGRAR